MALVLTEEQQMLRDSARDFLTGRAPVAHLRALRDAGDEIGFSRDIWTEMAEMGYAGIVIPEQHGGIDYGYTGLGVVLEETGRTLTPSPLLSSALLAASVLRLSGDEARQAELLPGIADGSTLVAVATEESLRHRPDEIQTRAEANGEGAVLNGCKCTVIDGHAADWFIVSASGDAGVGLYLVAADAEGVSVTRHLQLDAHSIASVTFDGAHSVPLGSGGDQRAVLEQALDLSRIGQAAELLGIAQQVFEMTIAYLRDRKQFGVVIGSFQALQHRAAHLFGEIEVLKSTVLAALHAADGEIDQPLPVMASFAKAKAASVANLACNEAIQMHGGIGMTDDFDLGFYIKRARAVIQTLGDEYFHLDRLATLRGY